MKTFVILLLSLGTLLGIGLYLNGSAPRVITQEQTSASPTSSAGDVQAGGPQIVTPRSEQSLQNATKVIAKRSALSATQAASSDDSSSSGTVDFLLSPQTSYEKKQEAWQKLREAGTLDPVIAELEQRMTNDSRNPKLVTTLGQAYLKKCSVLTDVREQGILAMQADKLFDTALNLDPVNWEARFTKTVALSYWPASLNKADEVIEQFQLLIQQQETQPPQPHFAQSYLWLGQQYEKAGNNENARLVWQQGAERFPGDEKLRSKLAAGH
jgi:hypothetical protein